MEDEMEFAEREYDSVEFESGRGAAVRCVT